MDREELPKKCNLVMQGGITSGVVYPGAILELHQRYQFERIGGASAGAIAAVGAAAAEYGFQNGPSEGSHLRTEEVGFKRLEKSMEELKTPHLLFHLFQPTLLARTPFLVLRRLTGQGWIPVRVLRALLTLVLTWWVFILGLLLAISVLRPLLNPNPGRLPALAETARRIAGQPYTFGLAIWTWLLAMILIIGTMLLVMLWLALLTQNFGLCWGKQPSLPTRIRKLLHLPARLALVEWLHKLIQECAGLPLDQPLTFEMLEKSGIHLRLVTTDLSYGRPVIMPLVQGSTYCYKLEDLKKFLPQELITHMMNKSPERRDGLRVLPTVEMPVVLAARLSLSFPFLLSAVRLYTDGVGGGELHPHLMSDGGITSNFPIHFFDDWLPTHPTFGLTLLPAGQNERTTEAERVELTRHGQGPRWLKSGGVGTFVMQMFDSARNWRDTAQAEMPTATGRICRIYLTKSEGGLNLDMAPGTIDVLDKRGHAAGKLLREHDWRENRAHHYRALMHLLQKNFNQMRASYQDFGPQLERGLPGYPADWCKDAHGATVALLKAAEQLGVKEGGPHFDTPEFMPKPVPVMRAVPDL